MPTTRLALIVTPPFGVMLEPDFLAAVLGSHDPSEHSTRTLDLPPLPRERLLAGWTVLSPRELDGASAQLLATWCVQLLRGRGRGITALRARGYDLAACFLWTRPCVDRLALALAAERMSGLGVWVDSEIVA